MFSLSISFLSALLLLPLNSYTQENCACESQFTKLTAHISKNYPFYRLKVNTDTQKIHDAYDALFLKKTKATASIEECQKLLESYLQIYRDGHIYLSEYYSLKGKMTEKWPHKLSSLNYTDDPLTGVWTDGNYRIGIVSSKDTTFDYAGILLNNPNENWEKGDIKFYIKKMGDAFVVEYGLYDKNKVGTQLLFINSEAQSEIKLTGIAEFFKENLETEVSIPNDKNQPIVFKMLTDKTFLMKIETFGGGVKKTIDSLVHKHHNQIISCENLIVDVRNNSGGNDSSYFEILPYVYSGPVEIIGNGFYLSPENKKLFLNWFGEDSERGKAIQAMDDYSVYSPDKSFIHELDTLYTMPKRVAVLQNEETVSSGETFVLRTRQSDRVIVYGVNSAGIVDGFNGQSADLGCFYLTYPTTYRSYKLPDGAIDPYGIAPDVYIESFMDDPYSFITQHLELMQD